MDKVRRLIWIMLLIVIFASSTYSLSGQIISGYVYDCKTHRPVENANVYFKSSTVGTTTNGFGYFKLYYEPDKKQAQLIISHVSYSENMFQLVDVTFSDTLEICLQPKSIMLEEAEVTAKIENVIGERNISVIDFNFIDENVLLLVKNYSNLQSELIITNPVFDTISVLSGELLKGAKKIYKDCVGQCHLVFKDSVYQIDFDGVSLSLTYPIPTIQFYNSVSNCLFESEEYLVFFNTSLEGFHTDFYAVNTADNSTKMVYSDFQLQKLKQLNSDINFIWKYAYTYSDIYAALRFDQLIMYKPSVLSMKRVGDSVYLFNFSKDSIEIFSKNLDPKRSLNIDFHLKRNWSKELLYDYIENKMYTTYTENSHETLFWIDLIDGNIYERKRIPYLFPNKIMVSSGYLYVLYTDSANQSVFKKIVQIKL